MDDDLGSIVMLTAVQISAKAPTSAVGRADSMLAETGDVKNPVVTEMWKDRGQTGSRPRRAWILSRNPHTTNDRETPTLALNRGPLTSSPNSDI
jgi:hypothetical protein